MSLRERRVTEQDEAYLGPVAIAQFVDRGWIVTTPLSFTTRGRVAIRSGWGMWNGTGQSLPYPTQAKPSGAANWPGRRIKPPGQKEDDR
jgi:hypothetical protein